RLPREGRGSPGSPSASSSLVTQPDVHVQGALAAVDRDQEPLPGLLAEESAPEVVARRDGLAVEAAEAVTLLDPRARRRAPWDDAADDDRAGRGFPCEEDPEANGRAAPGERLEPARDRVDRD